MRRIIFALTVLTLGVLFAVPATGIPGPDPSPPATFEIVIEPDKDVPEPKYLDQEFQTSQGWDFGDRYGYACAWAEFFQGGSELFEVHYQLTDYPDPVRINDYRGLEDESADKGGVNLKCGTGGLQATIPFDGTDHFPHMIHDGDGLYFFKNGAQVAFLKLQNQPCDKAYFVPGDQAGEAWLWWDDDGPTFSHGPGDGDLNCGGGPEEPLAVARVMVYNAASGVSYCTHSMHEERCSSGTPTVTTTTTAPPPPTRFCRRHPNNWKC